MGPRERLAEIETRLREIHEEAGDQPLSEEQQTEWDALVAERGTRPGDGQAGTGLLEQVRLEEARLATIQSLGRHEARTEAGDGARPAAPQIMQRVQPWADGADPRSLTRTEARDQALAILESRDHTRHLGTDQVDQVDRLLRTQNSNCDGSYVARLALLTERAEYRSAWQKLVTQPNPVLTSEEARAVNDVQEFRAMSSSPSAGGYGVPVLIDPSIILTAQGSLNPFRRISRSETITTDAWKGVSSAGVTWSYDVEASEVSDDSPTLAQPSVSVHEARGFIPYSIRIGQDYPGFADEMSRLLVEGYDELQAQAFATGSGNNQPYGILTALDANTNVEVVVTSDGVFQGADINKTWAALPDRWKNNATWVMSHSVGNEIAAFGNGNNLSFLTVDLTGVVETIRRRPIEFSSYFPDFTGTTGSANILVVGDFRNYLIVDRVGMSVELVPHLFSTTNNRPTGQRGWFAYARHGADSIADVAFRLLQNQ